MATIYHTFHVTFWYDKKILFWIKIFSSLPIQMVYVGLLQFGTHICAQIFGVPAGGQKDFYANIVLFELFRIVVALEI